MKPAQHYNASETALWLNTMTARLLEMTQGVQPVMLGVKTGGVTVAKHLYSAMDLATPPGELNISFYRDDFSRIGLNPQVGPSHIPFPVDGQTIILVDDVMYSGRTVRAAMNEIFDYGRPDRIILAVLVERRGHELPIRPDVAGQTLDLDARQNIKLSEDFSLEIKQR
jgi:pyrimidine operon attenuation protein/uracil phosphoribosyltransferase